jgi:hypothetical protein
MALKGNVGIVANIKPGNEPLPMEIATAEILTAQLGINVLLRGQNVTGGDALLREVRKDGCLLPLIL